MSVGGRSVRVMSRTPGNSGVGGDLVATADVLAGVGALLDRVDHEGRAGLDAEARVGLVEAVVVLARRVEALRAVLVGEAEAQRAAQVARGASLRSLLALRAQVSAGEAATWVFAGRDVVGHDGVQKAALAGEVSVGQARAIEGVLGELPATLDAGQRARAEQVLLEQAQRLDAKGLAGQARAVLEEVAPEVDVVEDELERLDVRRARAVATRGLTFVPDGRGSVLLRGQLPVLEAAGVERLVAAYTESDRRAQERAADRLDRLAESRTPEQRRADGLVALVAAHAAALQAAGLEAIGAGGTGTRSNRSGAGATSTRTAGAAANGATAPNGATGPNGATAPNGAAAPTGATAPNGAAAPNGATAATGAVRAGGGGGRAPRVAGDRPRVVVTLDFGLLAQQAEQAGVLVDGTKVTAGELRRLLCDADIVPVVLGGSSEVLDAGRAQRLVTPEIRRALGLRDGGCVFPGCGAPEVVCEAHHIAPWWAGGETVLSNLVLLCTHHHGTVEPLRFFSGKGPPRWRVRIAADGLPEFLPPAPPGSTPEPVRHQRTLQRALRRTG